MICAMGALEVANMILDDLGADESLDLELLTRKVKKGQ